MRVISSEVWRILSLIADPPMAWPKSATPYDGDPWYKGGYRSTNAHIRFLFK